MEASHADTEVEVAATQWPSTSFAYSLPPKKHCCISFSFVASRRVGALHRGARRRGLDPVGPNQIQRPQTRHSHASQDSCPEAPHSSTGEPQPKCGHLAID
uniref:Uncharacterized protein n=1 Tax=Arundo donax TaxID=35708 RepID=A0A0A9QFV7_ARUDO